ncbi:MAG: YfhO family protein, partial [Lachnospiraceae bacterium]|nr:YfhO family protein [Lachnospiraceae bacterium]
YSIYNNNLSDLFRELRLQNTSYDYKFYNLDSRAMLEELFGVKYIIVKGGEEDYLPYNYRSDLAMEENLGETYLAYRGDDTLPLMFTYEALIEPEKYQQLSAAGRQQALLQGANVPEATAKELGLRYIEPELSDVEKDFTIEHGDDIELENGIIHVIEDGAKIDIIYEGEENSENYLLIDGLNYKASKKDYGNETGVVAKLNRLRNMYSDRVYHENASLNLYVTVGDNVKRNIFRTNKHLTYCGQHDFLYNAGYSEKPLNKITIGFGFAGDYSFDDLKVVCQRVDGLEGYIDALKEDVAEDVYIGDDKITASIELKKPRLLCVSIPYSTGWKAYVDGKETKVYQTDTAFLGIGLDSGRHDIEFRYHTPYKRLGALVSLAGIIIFVAVVFYHERYRRIRGT